MKIKTKLNGPKKKTGLFGWKKVKPVKPSSNAQHTSGSWGSDKEKKPLTVKEMTVLDEILDDDDQ